MRPRHPHHHHGASLRKVLFVGFFVAIAATAAVVSVVLAVTTDARAWWREVKRAEAFASSQVARTWDDSAERDRLLGDVARDLDVGVEARDTAGSLVYRSANAERHACDRSSFRFAVAREGKPLGDVVICRTWERSPPWRGAVAVGAAVLVLWGLAIVFARKASRPLSHLVDVARRIGEGDLRARPTAHKRSVVEVKALADALAEMAERIEQQLKDQRALLAGASHELRTPLGHLLILVELLRQQPSEKVINDVEREVVEMNALVEKLLASSRLDFSLAEKRDVDAADIARRALERSGEPVDKLVQGAGSTALRGDPTLLLGALSNLIENARSHGEGVVSVVVEPRDAEVAFVVDDRGPGIAPEDEARVFEPFFHKDAHKSGRSNGSLGLGLALVKRIAEAHGGRAFATRRAEGGGRVGFTVARGERA